MATQSTVNWTPIIITAIAIFALPKILKGEEDAEEQDAKERAEKLLKGQIAENPLAGAAFAFPKPKSGKYRITLTPKKLSNATDMIKDGFGTFADDEPMILAGIKTAATKSDVASISLLYKKRYRADLREKIRKNLSKRERRTILAYVGSLPNYRDSGYKR